MNYEFSSQLEAEAEVGQLREKLGVAYAQLAGTAHYSDCSVHNAPAMTPEPCDCGGFTQDEDAA